MRKILTLLAVAIVMADVTGCCCRRLCPWLDNGSCCCLTRQPTYAPTVMPQQYMTPAMSPVMPQSYVAAPCAQSCAQPCPPPCAPAGPTCTSWDPCQCAIVTQAQPTCCAQPQPVCCPQPQPMYYAEPTCGYPMSTVGFGPSFGDDCGMCGGCSSCDGCSTCGGGGCSSCGGGGCESGCCDGGAGVVDGGVITAPAPESFVDPTPAAE